MMTRFKDEDYNTLILTFDKNSDIVTFEKDIREAEELGFKCLFRIFVSYGRNNPANYGSKINELNLQVDELLKESSLTDVSYTVSVLGDYFPEAYAVVADEEEATTIVPVRMASAISMREFKNKKNVKQNVKKC